jgi:hypothetical protein
MSSNSVVRPTLLTQSFRMKTNLQGIILLQYRWIGKCKPRMEFVYRIILLFYRNKNLIHHLLIYSSKNLQTLEFKLSQQT